jgi:hypothetical protein
VDQDQRPDRGPIDKAAILARPIDSLLDSGVDRSWAQLHEYGGPNGCEACGGIPCVRRPEAVAPVEEPRTVGSADLSAAPTKSGTVRIEMNVTLNGVSVRIGTTISPTEARVFKSQTEDAATEAALISGTTHRPD